MKCPGQDRRYWKPDAVYEVPCPECGSSVELFKDEGFGRCRQCGHRFLNPGADFGCAAWCALAPQCVGFAPPHAPAAGSAETALGARLFAVIREELGEDAAAMGRVRTAFRYAKQLVQQEGGDPRVVVATALLLEALPRLPPRSETPTTDLRATALPLLVRLQLDDATVEVVCNLLDACQTGAELDSREFQVVWDAHILANAAASRASDDSQTAESPLERLLKTRTGKAIARTLASGPGDDS